jgi:hypothetical protein
VSALRGFVLGILLFAWVAVAGLVAGVLTESGLHWLKQWLRRWVR